MANARQREKPEKSYKLQSLKQRSKKIRLKLRKMNLTAISGNILREKTILENGEQICVIVLMRESGGGGPRRLG